MFKILLYSYPKCISAYLANHCEYNRKYLDKKLDNNYFEANNVGLVRERVKHAKNS